MYLRGILALLVALVATGWSEAQLPAYRRPATVNMPTVNHPTVGQTSTTLSTPSRAPLIPLFRPGSFELPSNPRNVPNQTGNRNLPVNSQVMPRQNNNLGMPAIIPQGSQANVPLRENGNNLPINGGGTQQPLIRGPLGAQGQFQGNINLPITGQAVTPQGTVSPRR